MYKQYEAKMEKVQEQRLHLKIKFLFGYNIKIVIQLAGMAGNKTLVGGIFPGEGE